MDATAGDFRENLVPITVAACNGSAGQKFDVITSGKHNNKPGQALLVSALVRAHSLPFPRKLSHSYIQTQGCVNFDSRREAGDQVLLFSCGGRADGDGQVTDGQLFPFTDGKQPQALNPQADSAGFCLTVNNGKVDAKKCDAKTASGTELFTFA